MTKTENTRMLLSFLLVLAMLLTSAPIVAQAVTYPSIAMEESKTVQLNGTSKTAETFSFTPTITGVYAFISFDSTHDTYGYVLDADGNEIARNDDATSHDRNFCVYAKMTAGTTYLLMARFYNTGESGTMKVKVTEPVKATAVYISNNGGFTDRIGSINNFYCEVEPEGAFVGALTWSVSDSSVISLDDVNTLYANIKYISTGTATITLTPQYGASDSKTVTVLAAEPISIDTFYQSDTSVYKTVSYQFTPSASGDYAFYTRGFEGNTINAYVYNEAMNVHTSDSASSEDLYMTFAAEAGKTYLLTLSFDSRYSPIDAAVSQSVPATDLTLNKTSHQGYIGESVKLAPYFLPYGAIPELVSWQSDNEDVAYVGTDGSVMLQKAGTATITATSESGFVATCSFTVLEPPAITPCTRVVAEVKGDTYKYFKFTPTMNGTYAFISYASDEDTYGVIADSDMNPLEEADYGGENGNFMVECEMTAGNTYYLGARYYYSYDEGSFDVAVYYINEDGDVGHYIESYTCEDEGHSGTCELCGNFVNEDHYFDILGVCICGFSHTHDIDEMGIDHLGHWGICTICEQDLSGLHTFFGGKQCLACGFENHDPVITQWEYDYIYHWGVCDICGLDSSYIPHSFDAEGNCICGYVDHSHVYTTYEYDESMHWRNCDLCGFAFYDSHVYDADGNCDCGYYVHTHIENNGYGYDNIEHYKTCELCGLPATENERHSYNQEGLCLCGRSRFDGVYFGDVAVKDGEYINPEGEVVTDKPTTGYAYLKDGILTLHNFVYINNATNPFGKSSGIYSEIDLTIVLEGVNTIHAQEDDGIYAANAALTVKGDGYIRVIGEGSFDGIDVDGGDLVIESGIIDVYGTDHGIEVFGDLEINGGTFIIEAEDDGMDIDGDITINDGLFQITAEDNGIDGYYDITVNGGDFYIVTADDNGIDDDDGNITINDGYFQFKTNDEGISCEYKVYLNGGSFIFDSGNTDAAIEAGEEIQLGEGFDAYSNKEDKHGYYLLADENGDVIIDGIVKAANNTKTQLEENWVSFEDAVLSFKNTGFETENVTVITGDGNVLEENVDYTISVNPAERMQDGIYCVEVKGAGAYNGSVFTLLTLDENLTYGDANLDGTVNSLDAAQVLKHDATLIALESASLAAADVNGDGSVNSLDAAQILRFDAQLIEKFPIEEA